MNDRDATPVAAGSRAAAALARACDSSMAPDGSTTCLKLHLETVRDAALDLGRQLDALADENITPGLLAEGALRCADTANLAACAIPELPAEAVPTAVAAAHLSAEAARSLQPLVEAAIGEDPSLAEYALRDARNAAWRANLVIQQVEETPSAGSHGGQDE